LQLIGLGVLNITVNNRQYNSLILMRHAIDCETQGALYVAIDQPQSFNPYRTNAENRVSS